MIEHSLKNLRCDGQNCNEYASISINTGGHKGTINYCEKCFDKLYAALVSFKKQLIKREKENKK